MRKRKPLLIKVRKFNRNKKMYARVRGTTVDIMAALMAILHDIWLSNPEEREVIEGATRHMLDVVFGDGPETEKEEEA